VKNRALDGRIALVTGASRGIGRAVSLKLAEKGAHVILIARDVAALKELDDEIKQITGARATLIPIDMLNYKKIDQMGGILFDRFGKLDILIANAGILGSLTPIQHTKSHLWDKVLGTNLTANFRLIRTVDPLLRKSNAGRVIFVTSTVGHIARAYWGAYAVSKAGIEMLGRIYAEEVKTTNIKVNILNPGPIRTKMRAEAMPGENPDSIMLPQAITKEFIRLSAPECDLHGQLIDAQPSS